MALLVCFIEVLKKPVKNRFLDRFLAKKWPKITKNHAKCPKTLLVQVIARGAISCVVYGVGRMVSGKTTKGQKVGLVLGLVVVGWGFLCTQ